MYTSQVLDTDFFVNLKIFSEFSESKTIHGSGHQCPRPKQKYNYSIYMPEIANCHVFIQYSKHWSL